MVSTQLKDVASQATSLDEALAIVETANRTCNLIIGLGDGANAKVKKLKMIMTGCCVCGWCYCGWCNTSLRFAAVLVIEEVGGIVGLCLQE